MSKTFKKYLRDGEPFVWTSAAALTTILLISFILFFVILKNGIVVFWPKTLHQFELQSGKNFLGEMVRTELSPLTKKERHQLKIGNRDVYGLDFRWFDHDDINKKTIPEDAFLIERKEGGNFYGFLKSLSKPTDGPILEQFENSLEKVHLLSNELTAIKSKIEKNNRFTESIRLKLLKLRYEKSPQEKIDSLLEKKRIAESEFALFVEEETKKYSEIDQYFAVLTEAGGKDIEIPIHNVLRYYYPNSLNVIQKSSIYLQRVFELFFDSPRETNTEGGLFPAIFGTVLLIFLMSLLSFPLGVVAGIYLKEYAKEGVFVRIVRIAVNNLAGVPSIVYGIFGLVFFIYGIGGSIDQLFFPERLPQPTWGTGGLLWASLTLGLLTVPVVIVSTEEALGSIPLGFRESSYSLGATKFQTLCKILVPMASPGILTGFILAMARAAGEVTPLMITGVVKLAPTLPVDLQAPFLHFERKFMHLGFHIYDVGFQSPNVEAAIPMVYVTTLLLVLIVLCMTSVAIRFRSKMKKKYSLKGF